jgi:hypothetical protein
MAYLLAAHQVSDLQPVRLLSAGETDGVEAPPAAPATPAIQVRPDGRLAFAGAGALTGGRVAIA